MLFAVYSTCLSIPLLSFFLKPFGLPSIHVVSVDSVSFSCEPWARCWGGRTHWLFTFSVFCVQFLFLSHFFGSRGSTFFFFFFLLQVVVLERECCCLPFHHFPGNLNTYTILFSVCMCPVFLPNQSVYVSNKRVLKWFCVISQEPTPGKLRSLFPLWVYLLKLFQMILGPYLEGEWQLLLCAMSACYKMYVKGWSHTMSLLTHLLSSR